MPLSGAQLARVHQRVLAGESFPAIAADLGVSRVAIYRQHTRRYGPVKGKGGRRSPPLPTHLVARSDQGVAGLRNWRNDPAGQDGLNRLIARIRAPNHRRT